MGEKKKTLKESSNHISSSAEKWGFVFICFTFLLKFAKCVLSSRYVYFYKVLGQNHLILGKGTCTFPSHDLVSCLESEFPFTNTPFALVVSISLTTVVNVFVLRGHLFSLWDQLWIWIERDLRNRSVWHSGTDIYKSSLWQTYNVITQPFSEHLQWRGRNSLTQKADHPSSDTSINSCSDQAERLLVPSSHTKDSPLIGENPYATWKYSHLKELLWII